MKYPGGLDTHDAILRAKTWANWGIRDISTVLACVNEMYWVCCTTLASPQ